jgi:hypothetical protein
MKGFQSKNRPLQMNEMGAKEWAKNHGQPPCIFEQKFTV